MAVPDNFAFSLQDVVDEVNPSFNSLYTCFAEADINKFDSNYYNDGNDLKEFRNYGASTYVLIADRTNLDFSIFGGSEDVNITIEPDAIPNINVIGDFSISTNYNSSTNVLTISTTYNNDGGPRIGNVVLTHPQDSNTSETIYITQDG